MRRVVLTTTLAGMVALASSGLLALGFFADQSTRTTAPTKGATPDDQRGPVAQASRSESALKLPVAQVVLFNSGVGYFQREGEIEGEAHVDLSFPAQDVNDLLKSLVVQDLGGGKISAVSLESPAPVEKTLKSFAIDLSSNPSLAQMLDQARGERVEVVLQQSATSQPGTLSGSLLGVERQKLPAGKDGIIEVAQLNLWCAEGIRSVKLADLQRIRFLNPVLENELKKALEAVTLSHDTQKKAVGFTFSGQGRRSVRVGYVVENPIWKTTYRLVLDKEGKAFLQGWAVVENQTDEDWNQVRLALVSGRPVSFKMDLYQPLYVPRPTVEPELFASLRPPTYAGSMRKDSARAEMEKRAGILDQLGRQNQAYGQELFRRGFVDGEAKATAPNKDGRLGEKEALDLTKGIAEIGTATNLGTSFRYDIDQPVALARQKSSLLPLVNQAVETTRVSIYNERVHARFPLLGLRFKNATGLNLTQGPITVFDGSSYAGDARLPDLQPKEERLLSYAVDLGTEVQAVPDADNGQLTTVKLQKGVVLSTTKVRERKTYTVTNRSDQDRVVLIEHPFRPDFNLTSAEKPLETGRDVYRFQLKAARGETVRQLVSEERTIHETVALTNFDDSRLRFFIESTASSPKVKEALGTALQKRAKLAATQQEVANAQRELNAIKTEQPRLRSNLEKIPQTDPLAKRILEKLNKQETEIEQYEEQIKKLNGRADQERKDYEAFLAALDVA